MKSGGALLLVIVGLVALWVVITGRLPALQAAWATLTQNSASGAAPASSSAAPAGIGGAISSSVSPQQVAAPIYVIPQPQFAAAAPIRASNVRYGG